MKKFTVFTVILTIVVLVVFGEIIFNEYLPNFKKVPEESSNNAESDAKLTLPKNLNAKKSISTNVLGADVLGAGLDNQLGADVGVSSEDLDPEVFSDVADISIEENNFKDSVDLEDVIGKKQEVKLSVPEGALRAEEPEKDGAVFYSIDGVDIPSGNISGENSGLKDFEDETFVSTDNNVYLRDEQIRSAGFGEAYLEKEVFDGRVFKTILVDDLNDVEVSKTLIRTKEAFLAKVYVFKIGLNANANEVYELLKLRAGQGLNTRLNETNEFGVASFYMNDLTRSDTAFLTVRIAGFIYAFSYPKPYHSQVKNLIQLIDWELG